MPQILDIRGESHEDWCTIQPKHLHERLHVVCCSLALSKSHHLHWESCMLFTKDLKLIYFFFFLDATMNVEALKHIFGLYGPCKNCNQSNYFSVSSFELTDTRL
jgi:hypothetical protein